MAVAKIAWVFQYFKWGDAPHLFLFFVFNWLGDGGKDSHLPDKYHWPFKGISHQNFWIISAVF